MYCELVGFFVSLDIPPKIRLGSQSGGNIPTKEWLYRHICRHCMDLGIRCPRNKYPDVSDSYLSYCKKRKRKASRTRMLILLEKLIIQRDEIHKEYGASLRYTKDYQKRLSIIRKVLVRRRNCLKAGKLMTASSALTVIMYVSL